MCFLWTPESYVACLKEIARRLQYGRKFSDRIQSMAEELAHLREQEVQKREVFLRNYGQHLPRDFVPGLAEKPSHCEFRMRPFDQVESLFRIFHCGCRLLT
jgi:autophagy-related protein 11